MGNVPVSPAQNSLFRQQNQVVKGLECSLGAHYSWKKDQDLSKFCAGTQMCWATVCNLITAPEHIIMWRAGPRMLMILESTSSLQEPLEY